jgi:hypothetical protein
VELADGLAYDGCRHRQQDRRRPHRGRCGG